MAHITHVELKMVDLVPKVKRVDAIQSFVSQETPLVTVFDSDGASGTGYSYTIGTGGPSVMALLEHTLAPALIGKDPDRIEAVWRDLLFLTHATSVGAITSLALAAIDTALWDLRCKKSSLPLWKAAGGSREQIPLYTTEGGWLHLETQVLVDDALAMQEQGFKGSKIKIGSDHISKDAARLDAVRSAVGSGYEIMTDGNQGFSLSESIRWSRMLQDYSVGWFEDRYLLMTLVPMSSCRVIQTCQLLLVKVCIPSVSSKTICSRVLHRLCRSMWHGLGELRLG